MFGVARLALVGSVRVVMVVEVGVGVEGGSGVDVDVDDVIADRRASVRFGAKTIYILDPLSALLLFTVFGFPQGCFSS